MTPSATCQNRALKSSEDEKSKASEQPITDYESEDSIASDTSFTVNGSAFAHAVAFVLQSADIPVLEGTVLGH